MTEKTVDWELGFHLMTLEKKQAELLKVYCRQHAELEGYLTQNKTLTAGSAYRFFFKTYDNLEDKKQCFEKFDKDTKRVLE